MKTLILPIAILMIMAIIPTTVYGQIQPQSCPNQCPQPLQTQYYQPQPQPQPQYIQPQPQQPQYIVPQAQPVPQGGITIQNITAAITAALDPINKHLVIIDNQILNITSDIKKLQTPPAPLPPPTNTTTPTPPPPPPNQGSSCPNQGNGPGPMYYYPGPGGFRQFPGGQGFFPGVHHGGGHHQFNP